MKISLDEIKYSISIDRDELKPGSQVDCHQLKEALLEYDWILKASVSDMGPMVWVELTTRPEVLSKLVEFVIKNQFKPYLLD